MFRGDEGQDAFHAPKDASKRIFTRCENNHADDERAEDGMTMKEN